MASGKTTAVNYLSKILGDSVVIDADKVAKDIYRTDSSAVQDIRNSFGQCVICPDGKIDYRILGNTVFSSKKGLEKLNSIMFPRICNRISELVKGFKPKEYIIIDAAILFDARLDRFCDITILVKANQQLRKKLLKSKCSLSDEEIESRIKGPHLNINEESVDHIIENNGTMRSFYSKIRKIAEKITGPE
jgi:dephospho-CoA kinase